MLDRRKGRPLCAVISAVVTVLSLCHRCWHFAVAEQQQQTQQNANNKTQLLNRIPPSIYKWIEENAHICTIVPANGESLINFLSEDDGAKCALCPELGARELPSMACAIEVSPNEIDVGIGCHPVPELCVLELKTLYAEFFTGGVTVGMPPGPPGSGGPPGNEQQTRSSVEEDIFKATGNLFTSADGSNFLMEVTSERTAELLEEEEEDEKEQAEQGRTREQKAKVGEEVTTPMELTNNTPTMASSTPTIMSTSTTTSTTATTTMTISTQPTATFVRANVFARPSPQGFPINLTMEELHMLSRTSKPQKGVLVPPLTKGKMGEKEDEFPLEVKSPANTDPMPMKKRAKGRTGNEVEEEGQEVDEPVPADTAIGPCKDRHVLCCFWAMSGECDANPFWMRTKCPMTCGTCGCKVRNADKCRSVGVKCVMSSATTTTTPTTTTLATTTTTPSTTPTTTSATTPSPPLATPPRRRPRPPTAPNNQMPGHRPQRPRQRSRTSTTTTTMETTTTTGAENDVDHEESLTNGQGDADYFYYDEPGDNNQMGSSASANSGKKTVSGHSGKRVPEERIDAESRGPGMHLNWLLSSAGPGYDETEEDGSVAPSPMNLSTLPTVTVLSTTLTSEACFNYHKLCDFWAKMGECSNNPFWMRPHCQLSCKSCGETLGDISTPPARSGCNNEHILCPFWAFIGECARNPRWMSQNCRASCELC